jgi:hypothetical protein
VRASVGFGQNGGSLAGEYGAEAPSTVGSPPRKKILTTRAPCPNVFAP